MDRRAWPFLVAALYVLLVGFLGGLRPDHVGIALLAGLDCYNERSRQFLRAFFPFILTGVLYDGMRYFYWQGIAGHIHVGAPYFRDLAWFGITEAGKRLTPNEFFLQHHWVALDLLCGFAYLVFVSEYLLTAFYLFLAGRLAVLRVFAASFLVVNVMGFVTYFVYPAAPPWYVELYGFGPPRMHIHSNEAAAHRFDALLGTHFFDQIYGRGVDVYGAYPSLHVAYPLLVAWACFQVPALRIARPFAVAFYLLMCLSAVYLQHHYVVDILLGTLYAAVTVTVLQRVFGERPHTAVPLMQRARVG